MADEIGKALERGGDKRNESESFQTKRIAQVEAFRARDRQRETLGRIWFSVTRWGVFRVAGMGTYYLLSLCLFVCGQLTLRRLERDVDVLRAHRDLIAHRDERFPTHFVSIFRLDTTGTRPQT